MMPLMGTGNLTVFEFGEMVRHVGAKSNYP